MKIGVLSDTQGLLRPEAVAALEGCGVILHGGDINRQDILDELGKLAPVYAVRGNNDRDWAELGVTMTTREEVIAKSDIISIHIPATPETYHLFNKATFATMKDGAYLVNAARGALVDLDDLAEAMQSGKIAGAALDAFEVEPLPLDAPILKCENIVLTPHTGAETRESYYNVSMTTTTDILKVLKGEEPKFCVNR